jgi:hypothetical protein
VPGKQAGGRHLSANESRAFGISCWRWIRDSLSHVWLFIRAAIRKSSRSLRKFIGESIPMILRKSFCHCSCMLFRNLCVYLCPLVVSVPWLGFPGLCPSVIQLHGDC